MPIIAIAWLAVSGGGSNWPHLMENVIPRATGRTLLLVSLTGASTAVIGILTAWLVASCEFPLRRFLSAALVLPLAIPAYLAAYAFGELLTFTGPVQAWSPAVAASSNAPSRTVPRPLTRWQSATRRLATPRKSAT